MSGRERLSGGIIPDMIDSWPALFSYARKLAAGIRWANGQTGPAAIVIDLATAEHLYRTAEALGKNGEFECHIYHPEEPSSVRAYKIYRAPVPNRPEAGKVWFESFKVKVVVVDGPLG